MKTNTISQLERDQCTGCSACYNSCPNHAIVMKLDDEGFYYPEINDELCTDCGLCINDCPILNPNFLNTSKPDCYAAWANDEIRAVSSSGGLFSVIADYVFDQGGSVCGARFTDDYQHVEHILISDREQMPLLRRSKYVQSKIGDTFREIKKILEDGRAVLFSGCPCQVAGLYSFLKKPYENLITIDLICHGANSEKAYQSFLHDKAAEMKTVETVNFREKEVYGWSSNTTIDFSDGTVYRQPPSTCTWYKGFLKGIINRKSCGHCIYAKPQRVGDITLADFWKIKEYNSSFDDGKGTSLVLINNKKGNKIYQAIQSDLILSEKAPLSHALKHNGRLRTPQVAHPNRRIFFRNLDKVGYDQALYRALNTKYDIGIMGWWYNANYGGVATYYALHQILSDLGYDILMIDQPNKGLSAEQKVIDSMPRKFAQKHYECSLSYSAYDIHELNDTCDTFVAGSDQMWNYWLQDHSGPNFFFDFVSSSKKMIAYASSFGNKYEVPEDWKAKTSYLLQRFDYISVREDYGVEICEDTFQVPARWVLDPVFLCEKQHYKKLTDEASVSLQNDSDFVFAYILNPNPIKKNIIHYVSEQLNLAYKICLDANQGKRPGNIELMDSEHITHSLSEEEWMCHFKNCSYVVTDSYHGVCFSIIYNKPFVCIANKKRGIDRFISLFSFLGLTERLVYNKRGLSNRFDDLKELDYTIVNQILQKKKQEDLTWLSEAIKSRKEIKPDLYDLFYQDNISLQYRVAQLEKKANRFPKTKMNNSMTTVTDSIKKDGFKNTFKKILRRLKK